MQTFEIVYSVNFIVRWIPIIIIFQISCPFGGLPDGTRYEPHVIAVRLRLIEDGCTLTRPHFTL